MNAKNTNSQPDERLETLAQGIRRADAECLMAARATTRHAREVGTLLLEAKEILKAEKRRFLPWVQEKTGMSISQAQRYMQIANHWAELTRKLDPEKMTLTEALKVLSAKSKGNPQEETEDRRLLVPASTTVDALVEEAKGVTLPPDSPAAQYVQRQAGVIARQILKLARSKNPTGTENEDAPPPEKLALAVLRQLKKALKSSMLLRQEAGDVAAPKAKRKRAGRTLRPSRNGHKRTATV